VYFNLIVSSLVGEKFLYATKTGLESLFHKYLINIVTAIIGEENPHPILPPIQENDI
jgi:hypothetical protein